jgi:hypothetical protein
MMCNKTVLAIAIVAALTAGSVNATIVTNGDFSMNASAFTAIPGAFGDFGTGNPTAASVGWQIGWGPSGVGSVLNPGTCPWAPTSLGDVTSWGFLQGNAKLSQEVSLVAGQQYTASFELAQSHFDDVNVGRAQAIVQINDGVAAGLAGAMYPSTELSADAFTNFSYTFTATAAPSGHWYLEIYNSPTGDAPGLAFSNVSISAVPEPGTVCLLLTGVAGLLCYAWRKRK